MKQWRGQKGKRRGRSKRNGEAKASARVGGRRKKARRRQRKTMATPNYQAGPILTGGADKRTGAADLKTQMARPKDSARRGRRQDLCHAATGPSKDRRRRQKNNGQSRLPSRASGRWRGREHDWRRRPKTDSKAAGPRGEAENKPLPHCCQEHANKIVSISSKLHNRATHRVPCNFLLQSAHVKHKHLHPERARKGKAKLKKSQRQQGHAFCNFLLQRTACQRIVPSRRCAHCQNKIQKTQKTAHPKISRRTHAGSSSSSSLCEVCAFPSAKVVGRNGQVGWKHRASRASTRVRSSTVHWN